MTVSSAQTIENPASPASPAGATGVAPKSVDGLGSWRGCTTGMAMFRDGRAV